MTLLDELLALPTVQHRPAELCRGAGVSRLEAFGSIVRGDPRPDSDLDLLYTVDTSQTVPFDAPYRLKDALTELFGRQVELLSREILDPPHKRHLCAHVLASIRTIYEAAGGRPTTTPTSR